MRSMLLLGNISVNNNLIVSKYLPSSLPVSRPCSLVGPSALREPPNCKYESQCTRIDWVMSSSTFNAQPGPHYAFKRIWCRNSWRSIHWSNQPHIRLVSWPSVCLLTTNMAGYSCEMDCKLRILKLARLYDAPKCHFPEPRRSVRRHHAVDWRIWVGAGDFMLWLFGPAGAGKTAIAKRIAEISADTSSLVPFSSPEHHLLGALKIVLSQRRNLAYQLDSWNRTHWRDPKCLFKDRPFYFYLRNDNDPSSNFWGHYSLLTCHTQSLYSFSLLHNNDSSCRSTAALFIIYTGSWNCRSRRFALACILEWCQRTVCSPNDPNHFSPQSKSCDASGLRLVFIQLLSLSFKFFMLGVSRSTTSSWVGKLQGGCGPSDL